MPLVHRATFSANPLPWVWVLGWILTVVAVSVNTFVIYLITSNRRLQTKFNLSIVSLAVADLCFGFTYFPTYFTCEFYLPCDRELRQIFAAYFAFASLTNLCVITITADSYVATVMPFEHVPIMPQQCIVAMVILSFLFPQCSIFLLTVILKQLVSEDTFINFKISTAFVFQLMPCIFLILDTTQMFNIAYKHTKMIDCQQSLRMVTRARRLSEASETAKNKKPRGSWEGGLSPVSLSAISPSPVLPSLDSTD